ncbi:conserved hypothetical protein [Burkholderia ambifaria IOP40-10]|uniref:Uncharacterized protein n=1 Tax=Burkholderia ambifaria IOP40-10 TaxID=396596 RepID=B1FG39_9BURK|nr:hypothetical protein [Burkholderia ambifaria]EDT03470.1 conserved hypothetical protein [Burkholderia ambifaria IOP40-10]
MTTVESNRPVVDYATPDGAWYLLEHDDYFVRERFVDALEPQLDDMSNALAACFKRVRPILDAARAVRADRTELLKLFVLGGLDDLVVSSKLLLAGKLAASGNVARQAIEGIAMAMLCSTDHLLVIQQDRKKGAVRAYYWRKLMKQDSRVQGQHAVRQLRWNVELLGASPAWIDSLEAGQKRFNCMSHAGIEAIMSRTTMVEHGQAAVEFGGQFDSSKEPLYRVELVYRIELCRQLAQVMDHLLGTMTGAVAA